MNNKLPLISIALATFNGESFLREQINSIINQDYSNFELVISDDGSTDNTLDILLEYAQNDRRIKISENPNPRGFKYNFERAILMCSGDIIFLCDQDDFWYKNKISEHLKIYNSDNKIAWIFNDFNSVDKNNNFLGRSVNISPGYFKGINLLNRIGGRCVIGCTTSYKSIFLKNIFPIDDLSPSHDSWIQLFFSSKKHYFIDKVLQNYRQHDNNVFGFRRDNNIKDRYLINLDIIRSAKYTNNISKNKIFSFKRRSLFKFIYFLKMVKHFNLFIHF